jgi:hypothetical protein
MAQLKDADIREMNERWADSFSDRDSMEKQAALSRQWLDDHVREESLLDEVKEPTPITEADCSPSLTSYDPIIIDEIRDGQWAMAVDFTGSSRNEAVRQPKYAITIQKIQTATAVYDTDRIRMSRRPVVSQLREDLGDALNDAKDRMFVVSFETAVWFLFKDYTAGNATNGLNATNISAGTVTEYSVYKCRNARERVDPATGLPLDDWELQTFRKSDFTDVQNAFNTREGEQLYGEVAVIPNFDYNRISDWTIEEVGNETVAKTSETVKGYRRLKDLRLVKTGKHRWLRPGNVYALTDWGHLGRYVQMGGVETYQNTRGTRVETFAWMYIGLGYAILAGMKKMEGFSASCTPTYEDTGFAIVRPKVVEHVIRNNRTDTGVWMPHFNQA